MTAIIIDSAAGIIVYLAALAVGMDPPADRHRKPSHWELVSR